MQLNNTLPPVVVAPPTTTDIGTTITALIVAIGGVVGSVAAIIQRMADRKELSAHRDALQQSATFLDNLGSNMRDGKHDIKSLAEVLYSFMPDKAQTIVNQQNIRLAELTRKIQEADEKLKKIPPALDHI